MISSIACSPPASAPFTSPLSNEANGSFVFHSGCCGASAFTRSTAKKSWKYIGCSHQSVPSLSNVAMRSSSGTKSGEPSFVTFATNSTMDCLTAPSLQEGNGSAAGAAIVMETTMQASAIVTRFCIRLVFIALNFSSYRFRKLSAIRLFDTVFFSNSKSDRSNFRRRHRTEEYPQGLFPPNHAHQFVRHAIRSDEDEENDLNGPEMRPDDFRQQLLIACDKAASLPPEIDKALHVVNQRGHQPVDHGLPADIVDQRFMGKAIDHWQHVRD